MLCQSLIYALSVRIVRPVLYQSLRHALSVYIARPILYQSLIHALFFAVDFAASFNMLHDKFY